MSRNRKTKIPKKRKNKTPRHRTTRRKNVPPNRRVTECRPTDRRRDSRAADHHVRGPVPLAPLASDPAGDNADRKVAAAVLRRIVNVPRAVECDPAEGPVPVRPVPGRLDETP